MNLARVCNNELVVVGKVGNWQRTAAAARNRESIVHSAASPIKSWRKLLQ
jgi:hypothetical protein